jgi:hypothetical protein
MFDDTDSVSPPQNVKLYLLPLPFERLQSGVSRSSNAFVHCIIHNHLHADAEENIWTYEARSGRRLEKIPQCSSLNIMWA